MPRIATLVGPSFARAQAAQVVSFNHHHHLCVQVRRPFSRLSILLLITLISCPRMLRSLPTSAFSLLLTSLSVVHAVNFSVSVRSTFASNALQARDSNSTIPVHNTRNAEYIANITLGGREVPVLLDTGRCVRNRSPRPEHLT